MHKKILGINLNWDALGISTSVACALHCALLPLFVTSLPVLGFNIINNLFFEILMIVLTGIIGYVALQHGWKKHHHKYTPMILFYSGLAFLIAKNFTARFEIIFLIPAVILIIAAHYQNYRLCKKANHCHSSDCNH